MDGDFNRTPHDAIQLRIRELEYKNSILNQFHGMLRQTFFFNFLVYLIKSTLKL